MTPEAEAQLDALLEAVAAVIARHCRTPEEQNLVLLDLPWRVGCAFGLIEQPGAER